MTSSYPYLIMANDTMQAGEALPAETKLTMIGPRLGEFLWLVLGGLLLSAMLLLATLEVFPSGLALVVQIVRLPLAFAYILLIPGYCLTAALFPGHDDLNGLERTGLSLGLGIAWVSILALILDRLPWGLYLWPIFFGEMASILLFSGIAIWRRARLPGGQVQTLPRGNPFPWWHAAPAQERRIYQICAAVLLIAALALAWVFLVPSADEFMTEFYILGAGDLAEDYPREAGIDQALSVTVGIANRERDEQSYRIEVWTIDPWTERRQLVQELERIVLEKGESRERPIEWRMPWVGDDQQVEFYLFAGGEEAIEPCRLLRLWLDVVDD